MTIQTRATQVAVRAETHLARNSKQETEIHAAAAQPWENYDADFVLADAKRRL